MTDESPQPPVSDVPFLWRNVRRKLLLIAMASAAAAWVLSWGLGIRGWGGFAGCFLLVHLASMSYVGGMVVRDDKRRSETGGWRVPERSLLAVAAAGGSVGVLRAMYRCRHKTRRLKFVLGVPFILFLQANLLLYFFFPALYTSLFRVLGIFQ